MPSWSMKIRFMKIDQNGPILRFKDDREKADIEFCLISWDALRAKPRRCARSA